VALAAWRWPRGVGHGQNMIDTRLMRVFGMVLKEISANQLTTNINHRCGNKLR
jgi:hypothetical protein